MTKWPGDISEVKGEDCSRVGFNYVTRQAREVAYDAVTKYGSATIHTERVNLGAAIVKRLQENLNAEAGKGMFMVASANIRNLVTDPSLEADIKATAQAQFKLANEKNLLEVTKVQADRKREEAKGEADAIRIKAEAVSKQGGKEYVELKAIEKWDGKLPVTNAGGAMPLLKLN
jgi:regulator of protease activity HflC (stomatin/prohibitin superfamily)